jgi:hypothetical protein
MVVVGAAATPAFAGECRDPWVTQAIREVTKRDPVGAGETGECRYTRYGGGQWSSYPDLVAKVRAAFGQSSAGRPAITGINSNLLQNQRANGSGIVAVGAGNIVSPGGGNIVAVGAGNARPPR